MVSLGLMLATVVLGFAVQAFALGRTARAVGSPRGRWGVGALVLSAMIVWALALAAVERWLAPQDLAAGLAFAVVLFLLQVAGCLVLIRFGFRLSFARSFAPLGALVATGVAGLLFAVLGLRLFVLEAFRVPADAMEPTLAAGDCFVAVKVLRPRRFDLVVYRGPDALDCHRLVGLPGEELTFRGGGILVDGRPLDLPPVLVGRCYARPPSTALYGGPYDEDVPIKLGPDEYFFIGDNVGYAIDSRLNGPARSASLVGVADWLYWPPSRARILR